MLKHRDLADLTFLIKLRKRNVEIEAMSVVRKMFISPTRRLFKPTYILHNLNAVIRLSLRNGPFIIQGGWVLLGIGNNQIMEATTVLFQSEVEKKSPVNVGSGMRIPITIGPLVA